MPASLRAIDPDYLTDVLRRSGLAGDIRVRRVVVESSKPTILSRIDRLRLEYDGAGNAGPETMILKTGLPGSGGEAWNSGRQEVAFYRQIGPATAPGLVPLCFDAEWDNETREWHLLLEDLTDTHVSPTTWPLPPTMEQCQRIVTARARFHAEWWDDPRLGTSIGRHPDLEFTTGYARDLTNAVARFADLPANPLSPERRRLYEGFLSAAPTLLARYRAQHDITIVHGDAHVWNAFMPRDGGDDVRLFDWDSWRLSTGAMDLAGMMAVQWYPDIRRRFERTLLDHYHAALLEHGVHGYDRAALDDDYRLATLVQIATPVWQAVNRIPAVIWWNNFERIMLAVDDLGCRDLLG
jgi:hypothetical protein